MKLTPASARDRFLSARVARLATVDPTGSPHLVPVTFAIIPVEGAQSPPDMIVFAVDHKPKSTTALRRLSNLAANPRVSFLADRYDDDWDRLWWSRADAVAAEIGGEARLRAITALQHRYPQYESTPPDGIVVGATVRRWSGWQAAAGQIDLVEPPAAGRTAP